MIRIHDNRHTDDCKLKDVGINGFFMVDGCLCRRVNLSDAFKYNGDGYPVLDVGIGCILTLNPDSWVEPIRDEQIEISVEDWR